MHVVRSFLPCLLLLPLLAAPRHAIAAPPQWIVSDLGVQFAPSGNTVLPYSLNDLGQVAGTGGNFAGTRSGPFISQPGLPVNFAPRPGDPTLFIDQVPPGSYQNAGTSALTPQPFALNDLGVCTGNGPSVPHAQTFLGTTAGVTALPVVGQVATSYAINQASTVAGVVTTPMGWLHAMQISGGLLVDLGTFRALPPTANNDRSFAYGINDAGVVVGSAANDTFVPGLGANGLQPFRWTLAGGLQNLGPIPGGPQAEAYDINGAGAVCGYSLDPGFNQRGVLWAPDNALTVLPAVDTRVPVFARWINDLGWVAGTTFAAGPLPATHFIYIDGVSHDLHSLLIDDGQNWTNLVVTDMNNVGQLVGYGTNANTPQGTRRVFLLTPNLVTSTRVDLLDAGATDGRITVRWRSADRTLVAEIERNREDAGWVRVATVSSDGDGVLTFEDGDVAAGGRYGYRLALDGGENRTYVGETWLAVAAAPGLAFAGFAPNPSAAGANLSFSLAQEGSARLELFDVRGRRVALQEWAALPAGPHVHRFDGSARAGAGVYLARLTAGGQSLTARGIVLER